MLGKIAKLDAAVIRGVLVTMVPVLAMLINAIFGIDEKIVSEFAGKLIEALMALFAAIGLAYIAWARINKPTPPLSETAVTKTEAMIRDGKLSVIFPPPSRNP